MLVHISSRNLRTEWDTEFHIFGTCGCATRFAVGELAQNGDGASTMALHAKGWSQRRIARELGIDRAAVARHIRLAGSKPAIPLTVGSDFALTGRQTARISLLLVLHVSSASYPGQHLQPVLLGLGWRQECQMAGKSASHSLPFPVNWRVETFRELLLGARIGHPSKLILGRVNSSRNRRLRFDASGSQL